MGETNKCYPLSEMRTELYDSRGHMIWRGPTLEFPEYLREQQELYDDEVFEARLDEPSDMEERLLEYMSELGGVQWHCRPRGENEWDPLAHKWYRGGTTPSQERYDDACAEMDRARSSLDMHEALREAENRQARAAREQAKLSRPKGTCRANEW